MSTKKIIGLIVASILLVAVIFDTIRYLKPDAEYKIKVQSHKSFAASSAKEIIMVYNAWGGIYPGIADFINKEFFPSSYPCNLCYQTFGTFGMKEEWKLFLDSLSYKKTELHKDNFQRQYVPTDLPLPVIMLSDGTNVHLLINAAEMNQVKSLQQLESMVKSKLNY